MLSRVLPLLTGPKCSGYADGTARVPRCYVQRSGRPFWKAVLEGAVSSSPSTSLPVRLLHFKRVGAICQARQCALSCN